VEVSIVVPLEAAVARGSAALSVSLHGNVLPWPFFGIVKNALDETGNRNSAVAEKVTAEPGAVRQRV
jgi:hypothetical protein